MKNFTPYSINIFLTLSIVFLLIPIILLIHPAWYGDAPWYAISIIQNLEEQLNDPGHLFWRPLGKVFYVLFNYKLDALYIIQLLSSFFSCILLLVVFLLGKLLSKDRYTALFATIVIFISQFFIVYAGSGSSYTPAVALTLLGIYLVLISRKNILLLLLSALSFFSGLAFWLPGGLLLPAYLFSFFIIDEGSSKERRSILHNLSLGTVFSFVTLLFLFLSLLPFYFNYPDQLPFSITNFLAWIKESDHGIKSGITIQGLIKAVLGSLNFFIHLGFLGSDFKNLLSNPRVILSIENIFYILKILFFLGIVFFAILKSSFKDRLTWLALVAFFPSFLFAITWQGSDIERLCFGMPILVIFLVNNLLKINHSVVYGVICILLLNFSTLTLPYYLTGGGFYKSLGESFKVNNRLSAKVY